MFKTCSDTKKNYQSGANHCDKSCFIKRLPKSFLFYFLFLFFSSFLSISLVFLSFSLDAYIIYQYIHKKNIFIILMQYGWKHKWMYIKIKCRFAMGYPFALDVLSFAKHKWKYILFMFYYVFLLIFFFDLMSPHKIIFLRNDVPCFCLMMMYYVFFYVKIRGKQNIMLIFMFTIIKNYIIPSLITLILHLTTAE